MNCLKNSFQEGVVLDGRFETVSPLNHGSFGMVFMAKDLTNNELVAIKCLTKKSAVPDADNSFAVDERSEELEAHDKLGAHPNIVNMIHHFETDAHIYIVLEFCGQGDLYEAIRTGTGPLETEHVRLFMLQLVDAVAYIHSKHMYHRDIKPENIFLTQSGEMKLGDFGLATSAEWTTETTVGSDRYMSPEQYDSNGEGYSPEKADIWAIGICLLNIIFSRNPFTTPTQADPLFGDYVVDSQSLFDVFPTMSQDTYEVISQCMSLDPTKRSLDSVRVALQRVMSFTTDGDQMVDDFFEAERRGIARANREPLRTPSLRSPQVGGAAFDGGAYPWTEALRNTPVQQYRQLSVIKDYTSEDQLSEDLFSTSEASAKDWCSKGQQSPSSFGASLASLAIRRPFNLGPPKATLTPISGSLPITMSRPKFIPTMSSIFGKKEIVSKSWSDLMDEDEEEEEQVVQIKARQMQNARTYSNESVTEDDTIRQIPLEENNTSSFVNIPKLNSEAGSEAAKNRIDEDLVPDGFFFHDVPTTTNVDVKTPARYSPPPKRNSFDKWSALGERRRAYTGSSDSDKSPEMRKARRHVGLGFSGFGAFWDNKNAHTVVKDTGAKGVNSAISGKACPWSRERVRDHNGKDRRQDCGDLEWVGGWSESNHHL